MHTFSTHTGYRTWLTTWLPAALTTALLASCGGGGGGQDPILGIGNIADLAPTVTAVAPLNNATLVPLNTRIITAAFSEGMDATSLNSASFTLACPTASPQTGVVSYAATGNVATLTLAGNLPANVTCSATITTAAKDIGGTRMTSPFTWTFTTGATPDTIAPTVSSVFPLINATGVPFNSLITASFSEPMDPLTIIAANMQLACPTGTVKTGTVAYAVNGNVATFTPAANLPANTTCTFSISTAVKDVAGNAMVNSFIWSFSTGAAADTTAPTVTSTIPLANATGVAFNTIVSANFSEAMDPLSITTANYKLACPAGTPIVGTVGYAVNGNVATFIPLTNLPSGTVCTATITNGVRDVAGNAMANPFIWTFTTGAAADSVAPTITTTFPVNNATNVATNSIINIKFSEAMDPLTINTATVKLECPKLIPVVGNVNYQTNGNVATLTPVDNMPPGTVCTATVTNGAKDVAGNALISGAVPNPWIFTTLLTGQGQPPPPPPFINLASASTFGTFGGSAGMTNQGILTVINGNIGTTAVSTSVTGFHDTGVGCIYTESPLNVGMVNGLIYTAAPPPTVGCPSEGTATTFAIATLARADALAAYNALVAKPSGADPGAGSLANLVLAPGTYTAGSGSFKIQGGNLTLDAQGNPNAGWVFQMATSLTVGGPGAAFPQSIILVGGAQAKNVFWQVGSAATVNAGGGGTMVGTIIAQSGAAFSTPGNVAIVTLNGRVMSLGAAVTVVNTVINVPGP